MKILFLILGVANLLLAVVYPITNTLPSMFVIVMMSLALGFSFLSDYLREQHKQLENKSR